MRKKMYALMQILAFNDTSLLMELFIYNLAFYKNLKAIEINKIYQHKCCYG